MLKIYYFHVYIENVLICLFGMLRTVCLLAARGVLLACSTILFFPMVVDVHALSSDSEQDIEIEADTAELDQLKNTTVFRGNVIVNQGSIRITGDTMTVLFDKQNEVDNVVMLGQPATYRQLPDNSAIYDRAKALRMEYHTQKNQLLLFHEVKLVQQENIYFDGHYIEYDMTNGQAVAKDINKTVTTQESAQDANEKHRIQVIIKNIEPEKKQQGPANTEGKSSTADNDADASNTAVRE